MTEKTCGRPSRDEYFMLSAIVIATRASCLKIRSGTVIVKDRRIISSGYNGNPKGIPSCLEQGFSNKDKAGVDRTQKGSGHCLATHAEANAIVQNHEQSLEGATIYTLYFPCNECAKLIVSSVVYLKMYREQVPKAEEMFKYAGITVRQLEVDFTEKLALIQEVITSTRQ